MILSEKLKDEAKTLNVLYVEDEHDTRVRVSKMFKLFFKEVFVASDGLEAIEIFKEEDIDLIMTDLTMPKMDGIEMIKMAKELNFNQHVIILTAHNSSENLMETIDLQVDGFLLKPLRMDKMLDLLYKVSHIINLEKNEKKLNGNNLS